MYLIRFLKQPINHGLVTIHCTGVVETGTKIGSPGIEPFILQLTAAELFHQHIPYEFKLHPLAHADVLSLQILLQIGSDLEIVKVLLRRGQDQARYRSVA